MRLIDPLLMEFDREASTTRKLLERCPDSKLGWQPHPKSMTLGKLATHLATIPSMVASSVLKDGLDLATVAPTPPLGTTAEILGAFDAACGGAKAAMAQLDDARALASWTLSRDGVTLLSMPRIAFLRTILLNHSIHHRGQLSVYLRLLDVPVPAIYGRSADENPFG
ncbi:MAG TPA: DinB family protein [Thermoanaerobaculia bacterium]|nr:DinB family protein [Thermoanaerobaculia bacterium]HQR66738.1 DinB family protein [Thermoanaerobaculia bacterium]